MAGAAGRIEADRLAFRRSDTTALDGEGKDPEAKAAQAREAQIMAQEAERRFFDSYRTLGRLQTFVWINTKGFQKIMKKYDKRQQLRGTGNEIAPDFEKRLEKEAFCSGKLDVLMELFKARRPQGLEGAPSGVRGTPGGRPAIQLLAGNGNPELAEEISARLGVPLTPASISRFADGEVSIQIMENVRNSDVYIIQPTCPPVNDHLVELLLLISAARRASAASVTAVVPYYGYARQLCGNQIFNPTSMCAYATVSTQDFLPCFENSTKAIDASKNQTNRRRFDRDREF